MTPRDEHPDDRPDVERRLNSMFAQRAERVESQLAGPALRARAGRRPPALRRYAPPLAAAAAVAGIAVGLAIANSGGGGHPAPAGGSAPPSTLRPTSGQSVTPRRTPTPPLLSPTHSLAPGSIGPVRSSSGSSPRSVPGLPSTSVSTAPRRAPTSSRELGAPGAGAPS